MALNYAFIVECVCDVSDEITVAVVFIFKTPLIVISAFLSLPRSGPVRPIAITYYKV